MREIGRFECMYAHFAFIFSALVSSYKQVCRHGVFSSKLAAFKRD